MPERSHHDNRISCVSCAVITVSDTRTRATDTTGALICDLLDASGHRTLSLEILPDEPSCVRARVVELCDDAQVQAVLLNGGTGIAPRDTTHEAVADLFEKRVDGFGELFRMLSWEEVGAAAMLSRATAGIRNGTVVFSMPGATKAVRLAMDKLVLPQLGHIAALLQQT